MKTTDAILLADTAINQETILTTIGDFIGIAQVIGIAVAALAAIAAVIISLFASERNKDTWYGRAKMVFVIAALIVTIPQLIKWLLDLLGQGDKYKLNAVGTITKQLAGAPFATLKSLL
ncbi:hypothetical protein [Lactococcus allomyrinae]|uniref:Uncharacterized protein n=1 Tax=Lactococcus allomyrinae TaxID=2419773 RepID=A0A387BLZ1_9LACT|nr:hypothetical protein [Lactococcus allomyrinae]AYG02046.1 hypothetical protein D7I46_12980 [Lactococcus allomyrinae]